MLQVTVGQRAVGVIGQDQVGLDVQREGQSPEVELAQMVKVDAHHAFFGGVGGAH